MTSPIVEPLFSKDIEDKNGSALPRRRSRTVPHRQTDQSVRDTRGADLIPTPLQVTQEDEQQSERIAANPDIESSTSTSHAGNHEEEETGNAVSIYLFLLTAMVGAVVIIANQYTEDQCEGIQQTYVQWIILAGPQIAQILCFIFVGGVFAFRWGSKWCTSTTRTARPRYTTWDKARPDVVAQNLLSSVQKPGLLTTVVVMVIYCLFAVAATLNYVIDLVVVGNCLSTNETFAINTKEDLREISGRSAIGIVLIFCTFNFFFFGLALKQFRNTGKLTTAFLGGILVTHVLIWVSSFIQEASEDDDIFKWLKECKNLTIEGSCKSEQDYFSIWKPWLYPIVVEYSLITVSLTLKLWHEEREDHANIRKLHVMDREDKRAWHHYSNVGIAVAIFVTLPFIAAYMISSGLTVHWQPGPHGRHDQNSANSVISAFLWTSIVTSLLLITCFLFILVITARARKCRAVLALEDYLTIITGISVQMIAMAIFTSNMFVLSGDKGSTAFPPGAHPRLSSAMAVFDFVQGILQTLVFIYLKAIRLNTVSDNRQRLGIMLCVSVGAGLDLVLFFWATLFEGHMSSSIHASQVNVFGISTWRSFIVPLYPLVVFYRLHCFWAFVRFIEMIRMSTDRKMRFWTAMRQEWEKKETDKNGQTCSPGSQDNRTERQHNGTTELN